MYFRTFILVGLFSSAACGDAIQIPSEGSEGGSFEGKTLLAAGSPRATTITSTSIRLSWSDTNTNESAYEVIQTSTIARVAGLNGQGKAMGYTVSGLTADTVYRFTIRTIGRQGEAGPETVALNVRTKVVPANQPPVAGAGQDRNVLVGDTVSFSGSLSADPDGSIASYLWNFGDGSSSTSASPSHIYAAAGAYNVLLTVTDNLGLTDTDTAIITVTPRPIANVPPVANAGADQTATSNTQLTFSGSGSTDSDGTITNYAWSFGDGGNGSGVSAAHTYTTAGTFTVTLTVTDDDGAMASDAAIVTITAPVNRAPVADAGADRTGTAGVAMTFTGSATDPDGNAITNYSFNFGDGSAPVNSTSPSMSHTYAAAGTYTFTFWAYDGALWDSDTAIITIAPVVVANRPPVANAGPDQAGRTAGVAVLFTGTGSTDPDGDALTYAWTFGDGGTATGSMPSHTYAAAGTYLVTLTVRDPGNLTSSDTMTVMVNAPANTPPVANAGANVTGARLSAIAFSGSGSSDPGGSIASYAWNFGDGTTASGVAPSHSFLLACATPYTVTLTVTDNQGAQSSDTALATITTPYAKGDADANGSANTLQDVQLVLRVVTDTVGAYSLDDIPGNADLNDDCVVDDCDAILMLDPTATCPQ